MAWFCVELDGCLLEEADDGMGNVQVFPTDGALEAMSQLAAEGHRLTVFTSKFSPMPDDRKQLLKEQIEQELAEIGFPPLEVWTGTTKPDADVFIGNNNVTYDGDWGLVLAQSQVMLEDRGLVPGFETYQDEPWMGDEQDPVSPEGMVPERESIPEAAPVELPTPKKEEKK